MKGGRSPLHRWVRWVLVCVAWAWLGLAQASVQTLTEAQVRWLDDAGRTETVTLPYFYQADSAAHRGIAEFRLNFEGPSADDMALTYAIALSMVGGNASLWINGVPLERFGTEGSVVYRQTRVPQAVSIPRSLLQSHNELLIRIEGGRVLRGLPTLSVGSYEAVMPLHARQVVVAIGGRTASVVASLLVALIGLGLWWTQLRVQPDGTAQRERLYLFVALAHLAWTVRIAEPMVESLPLAPEWRLVISSWSVGAWVLFMLLYCMELAQWQAGGGVRWFKRCLLTEFVVGAIWAVPAWYGYGAAGLTAWYVLNTALVAVFSFALVGHAWHRRMAWSLRWLAFAMVLNVGAACVDLYRTRIGRDYSAFSWMALSSIVLGVATIVVVLQRFREARRQADDLSRTLELRVQQREAELQEAQQKMSQLLQEQARLAERSRILKNMHDGVGSHLSLAMRQLSHGSADTRLVMDTLRDGMDHLKLSIDMVSLDAGDVVSLLCSLRHRLEPRLQQAGVRLVWDVAAFDMPAAWVKRDLSHLLYVLYELVSNVLQHAQASELQVHCDREGEQVRVRLQDNGVGFDPQGPAGRGLLFIRSRMTELGGQVAWASGPKGTVVTLTLGD